MRRLPCTVFAAPVITLLVLAAPGLAKPAPTHGNVAYGPHEATVLDVWLAESDEPTPLVVFIHGGGFRGGSKNGVDVKTLTTLLDAGISFASVEYRFVQVKRLPAAHHDCARALQFLRSKADQWNFDKTRVGAYGGSAGAQLSMYLAFHDEMARPDADDPVCRESTRLTAVATAGGQATMDFDWWIRWLPEYPRPHRDLSEVFDSETDEERRRIVEEISALSLLSADDPPLFMTYGMAPDAAVPTDPKRAQGWKVHHVIFGVKLRERMDELGIESDLKYPGASSKYASVAAFFKSKLLEK